MKNIFEILTEYGIEVPEGKKDDIRKAIGENYVTQSEHEKKITRLEAERDQLKDQYTQSSEMLKRFDGIDPEKITAELEGWKQKNADLEADYKRQLEERDYSDAIKNALGKYKFSSKAAETSVLHELQDAKLQLKDGVLLGMDDWMKQKMEADQGAFVTEDQKKMAKFTMPTQTRSQDSTITREQIMAIKDGTERRQAIADHADLFPELSSE